MYLIDTKLENTEIERKIKFCILIGSSPVTMATTLVLKIDKALISSPCQTTFAFYFVCTSWNTETKPSNKIKSTTGMIIIKSNSK